MGAGVIQGGGGKGRRRRRGGAKPMSEINVTPFVDVMMVLLIIFMVAAPMLTVGVPVELPRTAAQSLPSEQEEPLTVSITAGGELAIQTTVVAEADLIPRLRGIMAERASNRIFLRADGAIPYDRVMQVMGALNAGGILEHRAGHGVGRPAVRRLRGLRPHRDDGLDPLGRGTWGADRLPDRGRPLHAHPPARDDGGRGVDRDGRGIRGARPAHAGARGERRRPRARGARGPGGGAQLPTTDSAPAVAQPDPVEAPPPPEAAPEAPQIVVPDADVTTEAPVIAPPTLSDGRTLAPDSTPPPAPRVAPEPTPVPPVEAERAPQVVEQTAPEPAPEAPVVEEQPQAAPEAATTRIITEADRPVETAPVESIRPRARPPRPVRTAEPAPETPRETPTPPRDDAVRDAVAAALSDTNRPAAAAAPSGPPMTDGEKDGLRIAVQQCWNTGALSTDALRTTVTVAVSMARDGRPEVGSIRMLGFEGGSQASAQQAYEAARRAIIRCGANGFNLPVEKYDHWRDIEMVFNPERMRIR
jgi:biopolymer transport protein ExbD